MGAYKYDDHDTDRESKKWTGEEEMYLTEEPFPFKTNWWVVGFITLCALGAYVLFVVGEGQIAEQHPIKAPVTTTPVPAPANCDTCH